MFHLLRRALVAIVGSVVPRLTTTIYIAPAEPVAVAPTDPRHRIETKLMSRHVFAIVMVFVPGLIALLMPLRVEAEVGDIIYHGRDLGMPINQALSEIQRTGLSQSTYSSSSGESITGSGKQITDTPIIKGLRTPLKPLAIVILPSEISR